MRTALALTMLCSCFSGSTLIADGDKELLKYVEEIRQSEFALQQVDDFLPCSDEATAKTLAGTAREWQGTRCWARIGWEPKGMVAGAYWVTVNEDATDFVVHGIIDQDGDGDPLVVTASKGAPATITSAAGVK